MPIEEKLSDKTPFWGTSVHKKGLGNRPLTLTSLIIFWGQKTWFLCWIQAELFQSQDYCQSLSSAHPETAFFPNLSVTLRLSSSKYYNVKIGRVTIFAFL